MKISEIYVESIKSILAESINSTIMLDFDETLAHLAGIIEEKGAHLTQLMEEQSNDLSGLKAGGELDKNRLIEAHNKYKHKSNVLFTELTTRKTKGTSIVLLRPHLGKFLQKLQSLPRDKAKEVVMVTGNIEMQKMVKLINKACNTSIRVYNIDDKFHPDSVLVDDDWTMAAPKMFKLGILSRDDLTQALKSKGQNIGRWIKIGKFRGNFADNELQTVISQINQLL
jgi:hypothetical protein